jgi:hypothetical protein
VKAHSKAGSGSARAHLIVVLVALALGVLAAVTASGVKSAQQSAPAAPAELSSAHAR